ncbi:hypothetical protein [Dyadobacter luticola]|uniref:Uncharacterized protein n=1 Tax=Dyadobacter luticola TaxID=1979387 RepID=A0A5R9KRB4_9BACT|nr:hypothetical protein [Dyadobacter luticola]TLU98773.1 hypothetical protein FEN17_19420 [Dyadobacter luticola]
MRKVFAFVITLTLFSYSCKEVENDVVDASNGLGKSAYLGQKSAAQVSRDLPPEDPGSQGGGGGDFTFVMPQSPTVSNASPLIPVGQPSSSYTPTGTLYGPDIVAFGPAAANTVFPFPVAPTAARLWMGVIFKSAPYQFVVRGYPLAISNGSIAWNSSPVSVQVVGGAPNGNSYNFTPCQSNCGTYNVTQGQMEVSQLSIDAQGKLTLKAKVTPFPGGAVIQVDKVGYLRWH